MKKKVELPLTEPLLSTYHHQGSGCAIIGGNPSIKNWYINSCVDLTCNRKFLTGYTTPEVDICKSGLRDNPYLQKINIPLTCLKKYTCGVIKNLLDDGNYVHFHSVDDFYIKGKSWYGVRHFPHDGLVCGYDNNDNTFLIYAYDKNWVYRVFKTPVKGFEKGRKATEKERDSGKIIALKSCTDTVELNIKEIRDRVKNYLSASIEKYPPETDLPVYGIVVHEYIGMFLDRHIEGIIPYERLDKRVFRLIWEHKKLMLIRISDCLEKLGIQSDLPDRYSSIVKEADIMRMLYASHALKRRDEILSVIKNKLQSVHEEEKKLLEEFLKIISEEEKI